MSFSPVKWLRPPAHSKCPPMHKPDCDGKCELAPSAPLSTRVCFQGPAQGSMAVLAKMHTGFSQQSQVPELLPICLKMVGQASQVVPLKVSPLPVSRPGEDGFSSISSWRWLCGTGPLGQCRCCGLHWVQLTFAHFADPPVPKEQQGRRRGIYFFKSFLVTVRAASLLFCFLI